MPVANLDGPCSVCGEPLGDHTVRGWSQCLGTQTLDEPLELTPEAVTGRLRANLKIEGDVLVADHVFVKALTMKAGGGVYLPAVEFDFEVAVDGVLSSVAKVMYLAGDTEGIRKLGRLVRDTANAAANATAQVAAHGD